MSVVGFTSSEQREKDEDKEFLHPSSPPMAAPTKFQMKAIIALLFLFNFIWLFTYLFDNPIPVNLHFHLHRDHHTHHHPGATRKTASFAAPLSSNSKPWPILPSYLPWSHDTLSPPRAGSCEGYFGNGFSETVDLLPRSRLSPGGGGGWFRCHYSETLESSICEGGKLRMNPERIRMSKGGETIEEVMGRGDDDELPIFETGAFQVAGGGPASGKKLATRDFLDKYVSEGEILRHTMHQLVDSIEVVEESEFECSEWIEEPTLLITRFEYANVFHTYTDWYSAYASSRVTGLPKRPHIVFVDGHAKTGLEEMWEALFSSIRFAKHFSGPVCFRHAVIVPLGYETALFKGLTQNIDCQGASARDLWANPDNLKTARLSEFGEMTKAALGFPVDRQQNPEPSSGNLNVLFVRREDYLAHPRHGGKVQSRLSNEQEVFDSLKSWVSKNHSECKVNLINGLFAHMSMKDQIKAIQDASVIIGAHGAGLTHMVSALPKTIILEIISSEYRRPHFRLIAGWKGLEYHAINLFGSYADTKEVLDKFHSIIKGLGC